MTAVRLIPIPVHSALEMLAGLAVGILPFALGLSATALVAGVVAGALIVGMSVYATDRDHSLSAHLAADQGIALGLAAAAAVLAFAGDGVAAALFAATAVAQVVLITLTRYSTR